VYALSTEFRTLWAEPLWDSFLHFHISLASVTTNMLLQGVEKVKVTWCQDPAQPNRRQPCWSNLDGDVEHPRHIQHQATSILSAFWRSVSVVTDYKVLAEVQEASDSGSVGKTQILCWRCTLPDSALWQMHEHKRVARWKSRSLVCYLARNDI
jgi:hypothetical protein